MITKIRFAAITKQTAKIIRIRYRFFLFSASNLATASYYQIINDKYSYLD